MGTRMSLTNYAVRRSLPLAVAALLIAAVCVASVPRVHAAAATMTVNTTLDGDTPDAVLTLEEGIELATGTLAVSSLTVGECAQVSSSTFSGTCSTTDTIGAASADTIIFSTAIFPPGMERVIDLNVVPYTLDTLSTGNDTISGVGAGVIVNGQLTDDCFLISGESSDGNVIKGLRITDCADAVEISGGADNNTIGGANAAESGGQCSNSVDDDADGFRNDGCPASGPPEGDRCANAVDDDADATVNDGCPAVGTAEVACGDSLDNDSDGFIDDGCPAIGVAESGGQCSNALDEDADTRVNDGCPAVGNPEGNQCRNDFDDDGDTLVNDGCLLKGDGNVIRTNTVGVKILDSATTANTVAGNLIGTDQHGVYDKGNTNHGIRINNSPTNTVGGTTAGARNVISGNDINGVHILGATATGNLVRGNYIGTNAAGTAAIANGTNGVSIAAGATGNTVGGTTAGERNVISGNSLSGVRVEDATTTGNTIAGNYIGTNAAGTAAIANGGDGLLFFSATGDADPTSNSIGPQPASESVW